MIFPVHDDDSFVCRKRNEKCRTCSNENNVLQLTAGTIFLAFPCIVALLYYHIAICFSSFYCSENEQSASLQWCIRKKTSQSGTNKKTQLQFFIYLHNFCSLLYYHSAYYWFRWYKCQFLYPMVTTSVDPKKGNMI